MFEDITIEELLEMNKKGEVALVDVRSPGEYEEFTIPGAVNIPLFTDEERAEIGTLYKQESVIAAKDKGLEIVSAKLPSFIKEMGGMSRPKAVFCWRGGMRSKTSATVLALMGMKVYRLTGGIRAYRQWVVETLENFELKVPCIVISGNTGSGKTLILQKLAAEGYPVIDIEQMAQHRGSIFGEIGMHANNQKEFESLLVTELLKLEGRPYFLMESESKRVGKVVMPDFLVKAKEAGIPFQLEMPMEERVRYILEDYKPHLHKQECIEAFSRIKSRIHTPVAAEIDKHLLTGRFAEAVALMLEHYYDPRYEYAGQQYMQDPVNFEVSDVDEAIERIKEKLDEMFPSRH